MLSHKHKHPLYPQTRAYTQKYSFLQKNHVIIHYTGNIKYPNYHHSKCILVQKCLTAHFYAFWNLYHIWAFNAPNTTNYALLHFLFWANCVPIKNYCNAK